MAYDADPNTGVAVYDSLAYQGQVGWQVYGGTSVAAPQWAALVAIADQGRGKSGPLGTLPGSLYSLPKTDFYDITVGSNGHPALPGYDGVTGRGTPNANLLISDLIAQGTAGGVKAGSGTASAAPAAALAALAEAASRYAAGALVADVVFGGWGSASPDIDSPANDALRHKVPVLAMSR